MACLGAVNYDPATAVSKAATPAQIMTAFDTVNARIAFTTPPSGKVRVRIHATATSGGASFPIFFLGVMEGATVVLRMSPTGGTPGVLAATLYVPQEALGVVSLTPGSPHTWDAAYGNESAVGTTAIKYGGPDDATANNAWGALQFEVWEA